MGVEEPSNIDGLGVSLLTEAGADVSVDLENGDCNDTVGAAPNIGWDKADALDEMDTAGVVGATAVTPSVAVARHPFPSRLSAESDEGL